MRKFFCTFVPDMDFLAQLNGPQRAAVTYNDGPQLVIAGAGSGKTRVLTYKIAYLLQQGVPAGRILALTFTNKAAREMRQRIERLVDGADARYLWMGTFHSICARILRAEAEHIGFTRDFTIYDTQDSKSLLKAIVKERALDEKLYKPAVVLGRISSAKNALLLPHDYARNETWLKQDRQDRLYELSEVYATYQERLREANAMDFDDLLVQFTLLLQHNESVRTYYQQAFEYVLVDEYQDTNYVQYLLVKLLAEPHNHVCVVGDDAQSIYSFRGADIRNILHFQEGYPAAQLFKLEQNYRSTQTIVQAANSLIHHNRGQIYKEVFSENGVGERITCTKYLSDRDEAEGVARMIQQDRMLRGVQYDDIAVLYRTNAQSRGLENELRKQGIAYRIYGGTSFYQRKEVKDAIAYLRLIVNPRDTEALVRIINYPARGIGDTTVKKVQTRANELHKPMYEVVQHPEEYGLQVSKATQSKLMGFAAIIDGLRDEAEVLDAYQLVEEVMNRSGMRTAAAIDRTPEGIDRAQNLQELVSGIHEFVSRRTDEGVDFTPITDFLTEVSLLTDQDEHLSDETSRVTLMTVHAAKGLEFRYVYIVGLEENLFPSQFCVKPSEIEEERRLLYVAITRAMEQCHITYAGQRFRNGKVEFSSPSRFLRDIDRQYLMHEEGRAAAPKYDRPRWSNSTWGDEPTPSLSAPPKLVSVKAVASAPEGQYDFAEGDRVRHAKFGAGTVKRLYRSDESDKVDVVFDTAGQKTLLLTFAKLQKE